MCGFLVALVCILEDTVFGWWTPHLLGTCLGWLGTKCYGLQLTRPQTKGMLAKPLLELRRSSSRHTEANLPGTW